MSNEARVWAVWDIKAAWCWPQQLQGSIQALTECDRTLARKRASALIGLLRQSGMTFAYNILMNSTMQFSLQTLCSDSKM